MTGGTIIVAVRAQIEKNSKFSEILSILGVYVLVIDFHW